jgi:hypothetical protein
MHKKRKLQKKRKFVGLEWHAALSAVRTWIGGHPDTRMNSRIRVSADPPDRQMPVSAACSEKSCESCASLWPIIRDLRFHSSSIFLAFLGSLNQISVNQCPSVVLPCASAANLPTAAILVYASLKRPKPGHRWCHAIFKTMQY